MFKFLTRISIRKPAARVVALLRRILQSPVMSFIFIAAVFGVLFIVFAMPFTGSDEEAHFIRAYGISQGNFRVNRTGNVEMPKSFRQTIGCLQSKRPTSGNVYRYHYDNYGVDKGKTFRCASKLALNPKKTEEVLTTAQGYSPTTYVPQVIAITVGKLFSLPIVWLDYLVRFAVLAVYICMVAFAIRLIPVRKWAIAGVALLPTSVIQITNPGGDYMLFGAVAILSAVVVRSLYIPREQLVNENNKLLAVLAVVAFLVILPKGIFPGVCFLPLILFYGGFRYGLIKKIILLMFALIAGIAWQKFGVSVVFLREANTSTPSVFGFPHTLVKTMFYRWVNTDVIFKGDSVAPLTSTTSTLGMPSFAITLMNILVAMYLFIDYPERAKYRNLGRNYVRIRWTAALITIAVIVGSFAAMFIGSYLQTGDTTIRGVQPRYFYPAFFMLAAISLAHSFHVKERARFIYVTVIGSILLLTTQLLVLLIQFNWV